MGLVILFLIILACIGLLRSQPNAWFKSPADFFIRTGTKEAILNFQNNFLAWSSYSGNVQVLKNKIEDERKSLIEFREKIRRVKPSNNSIRVKELILEWSELAIGLTGKFDALVDKQEQGTNLHLEGHFLAPHFTQANLIIEIVNPEWLLAGRILEKNVPLVENFLKIAERKVSMRDEYGDEDKEALEEEIETAVHKLAKREKDSGTSSVWTPPSDKDRSSDPVWNTLTRRLRERFETHHAITLKNPAVDSSVTTMAGTEFETYFSRLLEKHGYLNVRGTPTTGDQGADILAEKDGRTIVIQAKRWQGSVGNGAVQEVVAAKTFYRGDEAWVVTNSYFTKSAKELAQANNVRLIDGNDLKDWIVK